MKWPIKKKTIFPYHITRQIIPKDANEFLLDQLQLACDLILRVLVSPMRLFSFEIGYQMVIA